MLVVDRAWRQLSGLRIGTGLPGLLMAGRFFGRAETVAVCHRTGPGVRVDLQGVGPTRLVATVDDPEGVARMIRQAAGLAA